MLELSIDVRNVRFGRRLKQAAQKAAQTAVLLERDDGVYEAALLVTDDETLKHLNRVYREADKATDVLSFPSGEDVFLGDIGLSLERARAQAKEYGHPVKREVAFLVTHAMLHLLGYTHKGDDDEKRMRSRQREILKEAGYERP